MIKAFEGAPGITLVGPQDGILAPNRLIELMRDVGGPRADLWEVGVRNDILDVKNTEAFSIYQFHNEDIVVPETVDAVRTLTGIEKDGKRSIEKTDKTLGIKKKFYRI